MGRFLTLRRIILRKPMRAILPGMSNDVIGMIKGTSIASVIFVNELTFPQPAESWARTSSSSRVRRQPVYLPDHDQRGVRLSGLVERRLQHRDRSRRPDVESGFSFFSVSLSLPRLGPKLAEPPAPAALRQRLRRKDNVAAAASLDWIRNITNPTSARNSVSSQSPLSNSEMCTRPMARVKCSAASI